MTEPANFDVFIIGGGQAGPPLAGKLAEADVRVGLAERKHLGGSCVNFGCTPTKAAIASARVAHLARRGAEYGLRIPTVEVDFAAVIERARKIAMASRSGLDRRMEGSENPKLFRDHARLDGKEGEAFRIRIGNNVITARQVVLDTGTRSAIPPIPGLSAIKYIHAGNWLDLTTLPKHLAIIGAGAIGLEMAQFYRRMGSQVTVIEFSDHIAGHEDPDVAQAMQALLEAEGVEFRLKTAVAGIEANRDGAALQFGQDGASTLQASHVFVATGRKPNTDDLGLETVGVTTTKQGIVEVDERLATKVKGIWAAGDIRGGPQFTHTAWDDYRVLMSQLRGDGSHTTKRVVPYAIFTDPELGRVGMTEAEARRAGHSIKIGRFDMSNSGKAYEIGEDRGSIKVIVDSSSNLILGAAVLAVDGAELVHDYVDLMNAKAPYTVIRDAVYIHPTLAEAVQSAVSEI
jgi:pyruvate/2-oxoglutarate dehydrogenase complex dihydrolipoamide dehydrogenase (E3) component